MQDSKTKKHSTGAKQRKTPGGVGEGTSIHWLYRYMYVLQDRVCFLKFPGVILR